MKDVDKILIASARATCDHQFARTGSAEINSSPRTIFRCGLCGKVEMRDTTETDRELLIAAAAKSGVRLTQEMIEAGNKAVVNGLPPEIVAEINPDELAVIVFVSMRLAGARGDQAIGIIIDDPD